MNNTRELDRLIAIYLKPGEWQHTTGTGNIIYQGALRRAEIHWFQEPTIGIKLPRVKRWIK